MKQIFTDVLASKASTPELFPMCFSLFLSLFVSISALAAPESSIDQVRETLDQTEFAEERAAQQHGAVITELWDELRKLSSNYPDVAKTFLQGTLTAPARLDFDQTWNSAFGKISASSTGGATQILLDKGIADFFLKLREAGWRLDESEFHHLAFESVSAKDKLPRSTVSITLHVSNRNHRIILRGKVGVTWSRDGQGQIVIERVDASKLLAWLRTGELPFKMSWQLRASDIDPKRPSRLHPLFVDDFDGDGLPEIGLGGTDIWLRNQGGLKFGASSSLLSSPESLSSGAAIADFNGDGRADLLASGYLDKTLKLHLGSSHEQYENDQPPFQAAKPCFEGQLHAPQCMTVADVDRDGDLDVFLGQYKAPYQEGNMPTPFYDANDGFPSYLLINDGHGNFEDATESAGLAAKRHRRVYGASFVDLNGDQNLDLAVTSDFAGVDVYEGDGQGKFVDRTGAWLAQPRLFGMSHVLSDFNRDGLVDLYAVGMASTTARRLERMKLGRKLELDITEHRAEMGHGNRLYLASNEAAGQFGLAEPKYAHDLAESGWSWGAAAPDLDNNGLRDLYIANGHISGKSACDYCSTFWRHDIYTSARREDGQKWQDYFVTQLKPLVQYETSWNGFEHNVAFMQQKDGQFVNLSYLLGLSHEGDSRVVIAADLDRDGDMDLMVTTLDPVRKLTHRLMIFENQLRHSNDTAWIGVDLGGPNALPAPWNAKVTLTRDDGTIETAVVTTGGAFCSQQPTTCHFGLGADTRVESVLVNWPSGETTQLDDPAVNQWHRVAKSTAAAEAE